MNTSSTPSGSAVAGGLFATATFCIWGLNVFYFKAITQVSDLEILVHRVMWSWLFVVGILIASGAFRRIKKVIHSPRTLLTLVVTAAVIAANWLLYVYTVHASEVLQASLGYYINPLLNVALGAVFLGERLRRAQWVSVALAAVGVAVLTWQLGEAPWLALSLAGTFGLYGLLRKIVEADALVGLAVETTVLLPFALGYFAWLVHKQQAMFVEGGAFYTVMLVGAGVITATPLSFFSAAVRRLTLSTVGFFQYIAPTGQFLVAVFVFGEVFTQAHAIAFALIWCAVANYAYDAWRFRVAKKGAQMSRSPTAE